MNILITGATGFIASQIAADLIAAGHHVSCCVRDTEYARNIFPQAEIISCNFSQDITADVWIARLKNIDVVINCVGIFYHPNKKVIWDIHYHAPRALFDACVLVGVKKVIQLSALGIDKVDVDYASSKKAADDYLLNLPIKSIVLRPSLVYSSGSYGGSSLFRGLAGLPAFIPVPGKGDQQFQPIHLHDLAKAVVNLVAMNQENNLLLNAVSAKKITLVDVLKKTRAWLGFAKAKIVFIPLLIIKIITKVGDIVPYSSVNSTAYNMLMQNNVTSDEEAKQFANVINFTPRDFFAGIYSEPSTVQSHWHARLYFLKPVLRLSLAFLWLLTAACSVYFYPVTDSLALLGKVGVNEFWQPILLYGASAVDALIGFALLINYQLKKICVLQIILIIIYTLIITWKLPQLWLEPFAPIAKNIPLLAAICVLLAMGSDR